MISIIGKDRVLAHLQKNVGSSDVLDSLITTFGNDSQIKSFGKKVDEKKQGLKNNNRLKDKKST